MARDWFVDGFTPKAWTAIKDTVRGNNYAESGSDYFGAIMCGAVCFDIVLRDVGSKKPEWLLCADPYIIGIDSGYAYTRERGTPYDEYDGGFVLEFHRHMTFDDTLRSFVEQVADYTAKDETLSMYADREDITWKAERGNK